jgi:hypothetical protein
VTYVIFLFLTIGAKFVLVSVAKFFRTSDLPYSRVRALIIIMAILVSLLKSDLRIIIKIVVMIKILINIYFMLIIVLTL